MGPQSAYRGSTVVARLCPRFQDSPDRPSQYPGNGISSNSCPQRHVVAVGLVQRQRRSRGIRSGSALGARGIGRAASAAWSRPLQCISCASHRRRDLLRRTPPSNVQRDQSSPSSSQPGVPASCKRSRAGHRPDSLSPLPAHPPLARAQPLQPRLIIVRSTLSIVSVREPISSVADVDPSSSPQSDAARSPRATLGPLARYAHPHPDEVVHIVRETLCCTHAIYRTPTIAIAMLHIGRRPSYARRCGKATEDRSGNSPRIARVPLDEP